MAFFLIQDPDMRERFIKMMNTRAAENPKIVAMKKLIESGPGSEMVIFQKYIPELLATIELLLAAGTAADLEEIMSEVVIEWEKQQAENGGH